MMSAFIIPIDMIDHNAMPDCIQIKAIQAISRRLLLRRTLLKVKVGDLELMFAGVIGLKSEDVGLRDDTLVLIDYNRLL